MTDTARKRFGLTARQLQALEVIDTLTKRSGGVCPSHQEVADALSLKSVGATSKLIDRLIERGHLRRIDGRHRALEVVRATSDRPSERRGRPPAIGGVAALIRHYRACECDDVRIQRLTGLPVDQISQTPGSQLLPLAHLEALRAKPGIP